MRLSCCTRAVPSQCHPPAAPLTHSLVGVTGGVAGWEKRGKQVKGGGKEANQFRCTNQYIFCSLCLSSEGLDLARRSCKGSLACVPAGTPPAADLSQGRGKTHQYPLLPTNTKGENGALNRVILIGKFANVLVEWCCRAVQKQIWVWSCHSLGRLTVSPRTLSWNHASRLQYQRWGLLASSVGASGIHQYAWYAESLV